MMYAKSGDALIEATPKARAKCPGCGATVIAKCGSVNVHHWAHESSEDCDSWSEGETAWHRKWKERFPAECREVVVGCHRADVLMDKTVYEFQSKALSTEDMIERETHYRKLGYVFKWIFNGTKIDFGLRKKMSDAHWSFRWYHGWKRVIGIQTPFFLDLGQRGLFMVKKISNDRVTFGYGQMIVRHLNQPEIRCRKCNVRQDPGEEFNEHEQFQSASYYLCDSCEIPDYLTSF